MFASLWQRWQSESGPVESCPIITAACDDSNHFSPTTTRRILRPADHISGRRCRRLEGLVLFQSIGSSDVSACDIDVLSFSPAVDTVFVAQLEKYFGVRTYWRQRRIDGPCVVLPFAVMSRSVRPHVGWFDCGTVDAEGRFFNVARSTPPQESWQLPEDCPRTIPQSKPRRLEFR